jgi:hypothetical protein
MVVQLLLRALGGVGARSSCFFPEVFSRVLILQTFAAVVVV